jgi:hypothetical protein
MRTAFSTRISLLPTMDLMGAARRVRSCRPGRARSTRRRPLSLRVLARWIGCEVHDQGARRVVQAPPPGIVLRGIAAGTGQIWRFDESHLGFECSGRPRVCKTLMRVSESHRRCPSKLSDRKQERTCRFPPQTARACEDMAGEGSAVATFDAREPAVDS